MRRGLFAITRRTQSMPDVTHEMAQQFYARREKECPPEGFPGDHKNNDYDNDDYVDGDRKPAAVRIVKLDETSDSSTATTSSAPNPAGHQYKQCRRFSASAPGSDGAAGSIIGNVSSINMMEYDMAVNPEERARKGQCPSCGQQLYLVTTARRWFFKRNNSSNGSKPNTRKKPLTVPGLVNRGQCLKCSSFKSNTVNTTNSDTDQAPIARAAVTSTTTMAACARASNYYYNNSDEKSLAAATTVSQASLSSTAALYEGPHNALGERHGRGTMRWTNGDKYTGEFYQGSRQGTGTLNFADGSEYVGDWWNNHMHGSGTRRFVNGDIYVGDYRYNRREGSGRFYFSNGDLYYGNWKEDKMEGFGRYYYHSGQRFEGHFEDGKRQGKGKLQRTDGSLDLFRYEADRRVGTGVRWSTDRTKAWRLDLSRGTVKARKVTVAEAVSLVYQIEGAAFEAGDEGAVDNFTQMLTLEDTVGAA